MAGDEAKVSNVCQCSWSNIAWVAMCSSGQLRGWVHCTHSVSLQREKVSRGNYKLTKKPCFCKPYFPISNFILRKRVL